MQAMIDELAKQAAESLGQVSSKETLASFWQEYLSKNGKIPALMKNLRSVAPEERPAMGKIINELKQKVQADYDAAAAKRLDINLDDCIIWVVWTCARNRATSWAIARTLSSSRARASCRHSM